ncbi:MAG: hypothetical protein AB2A00_25705, partial [Myxococcota bacterium]
MVATRPAGEREGHPAVVTRTRHARSGANSAWWAGALLVVLHVLWWWPALRGDEILYARDLWAFGLPFKLEAARQLVAGQVPLFSQALMAPLWSHPSAAIADPGTLVFALLADVHRAAAVSQVLHGLVAAWAAYACARGLRLRPVVATWCAVA